MGGGEGVAARVRYWGWLLECNIEGVVGKVTPAFKDSQPFLSKIVGSSQINHVNVSPTSENGPTQY